MTVTRAQLERFLIQNKACEKGLARLRRRKGSVRRLLKKGSMGYYHWGCFSVYKRNLYNDFDFLRAIVFRRVDPIALALRAEFRRLGYIG